MKQILNKGLKHYPKSKQLQYQLNRTKFLINLSKQFSQKLPSKNTILRMIRFQGYWALVSAEVKIDISDRFRIWDSIINSKLYLFKENEQLIWTSNIWKLEYIALEKEMLLSY